MKLIDKDLKPAYGDLQIDFRNNIQIPNINESWKMSIQVWNLVWDRIGSQVFRQNNRMQILISFNEE
jgi:hypothetical protein